MSSSLAPRNSAGWRLSQPSPLTQEMRGGTRMAPLLPAGLRSLRLAHAHKKEAAPKGGFRLVLLGLRLEEYHATELEEVEVIEALICLAAVRSRAVANQVEAPQIHVQILMLPPGEDVHGG